jgi:predicted acylesterase/phospholipase RssA
MRRRNQRWKRDERSASAGAVRELGLVGWVLAGGDARGAYEVGVCDYIFEHVAPELAGPLPLDVVSGTSVGAIHGCAIASRVDDPRAATKALIERWTALRIDDVIRVDRRRAFNMIRALFGRPPRWSPEANRGGILDPRPLERASRPRERRREGQGASIWLALQTRGPSGQLRGGVIDTN